MDIKTFKNKLTRNEVKHDETRANKKNDYKVLQIKGDRNQRCLTAKIHYFQITRKGKFGKE